VSDKTVSDERLRNTRAWAAARIGHLSGAEVIVAACDEALAARASGEDAARYRWLRDLECCSFSLSHDDSHKPNYTTAKEWIESYQPDWFEDVPPDELQKMKDANSIWCLQIYPNTPIGFNTWHGATLDAAIDAAITAANNGGEGE
jgi:hypothetical protein